MALDPAAVTRFDSNWLLFGQAVADSLVSGSVGNDQKLNNVYYDYAYCCFQMYDRSPSASYLTWAERGRQRYQDNYLTPNNGILPAFWCFTHGLAEFYLRDGNTTARTGINQICSNAPYHRNTASELSELTDSLFSRENAYSGISYINQVRCGGTPNAFLGTRKTNALNHITEWTTGTAPYFRPFMGALTAWFLIDYYTYIEQDPAIIPALVSMASYTNSTCWVPASKSWTYTDRETGNADPADRSPAPDLNLLICPYLGWLWWQTGDEQYRTRGDEAFEGGVSVYSGGFWVSGAFLGGTTATGVSGKQVNQNYFWAAQYLDWRSRAFIAGPPDATTGTNTTYAAWPHWAGRDVNLATSSLELALLGETYIPNDENEVWGDISTHEVVGNGYARATLTGRSWSRLAGVSSLSANSATFAATGGDIVAKWWVVMDASHPSRPLIARGLLWEDELPVTIPAGRSITLNFAGAISKVRVVG